MVINNWSGEGVGKGEGVYLTVVKYWGGSFYA